MIVLIGLAMGVGISFRRGGDNKEREIGYDFKRYEIRRERKKNGEQLFQPTKYETFYQLVLCKVESESRCQYFLGGEFHSSGEEYHS